ncbi:EAL domain-containing protein [Sulfuricurvum sp.]|uniref:sensor domain-containing phosphodiesterase n=1 Tax=Sulfuricurvum sp. TaxID=2025608 RepID=UPI0035674862
MDKAPSCLSLETLEEEVILTPFEYSKILDIQQNVLELLAVGHNQQEVMERLCQLAEKMLSGSVASIMLLDPKTGLMNVISAPSIPEVGHKALEGLKPGPGGGSCGNAVFHNEPQFVVDTKTDKRWADIRQVAYDFNLCSCWSMPIRDSQKQPVGSFALSSFEHRSPSSFHKRLLETCAFIVNVVLKRSEYEMQIDANNHDLELLGTAVKYATDGMIITDRNNNIIKVNNAFIQTFDFQLDDVMGKNPKVLASGRHDKHFYEQMWEKLLSDKHWSGEIWNQRSNGEVFPEWMSISAILNSQGAVENYLAVFTDLSILRDSQEKALRLAYYDQLTGLPNRQKIVSDMEQKSPTACMIFNIDDFKEVNDFFGIDTGDQLLSLIGQWFNEMNLFPYRIDGDEFAILMHEEVSWDELGHQIKTLLSRFEEKIFMIEEESISIRMSVGASIGKDKLLTRADIALNRAKENKVPIALYAEDEKVEETYRANMAMNATIRSALANQRIICHYQPIVNLVTGATDKYETLVRMFNEEGTIISPLDFLPIAKKTKLYPQITLAVIHQACALFATRSEEFSVNLSVSDIRDSHTIKEIVETIIQTGTASRIVFEILESEGIENYTEVAKFITQVKALGSKIAIDDFGTGYSNFENILKLNVDYIKIDGSLIREITKNSRHHIIVETIVSFAQKVGAKTIAEFVSDEDIYNAVKQLGIDYSQGYFTGKPQAM